MTRLAERYGRTLMGFAAGLAIGGATMAVQGQSNRIPGNGGVNHVGISVTRMEDAIAYYTKTMGFQEAAVLRDEKGQPTLAFIQVSRNTFIELNPATADRPAGLTHFGLQVDDAKVAAATLKQRGVTIEDPRPGRTVSFITSMTDPTGVRIEFSELRPDSMLGKAITSWK